MNGWRRKVAAAPTSKESLLLESHWVEAFYAASKKHPWYDAEGHLYSIYYRDHLTQKEKDEFLKVPVTDLHYFCRKCDPSSDPSWLRDMLSDAVTFFKLHNTWQVYVCPICDCLRWFSDDDSLVLHLMDEHCAAWPFLRQNSTEEHQCVEALRATVWEPIDVASALSILCTKHTHLDADELAFLEWPLSSDYSRTRLLAQLQQAFLVLLNSRERDSFTGCLRALIAVASEDLLRHLDPMNILPLPFRALLYRSPLSFRFMNESSLLLFVSLVEEMCHLTQASDVNLSESELLDAVSFSSNRDYFVLDGAKLNLCGINEEYMSSWLFQAPYYPTIKELPTFKASEILKLAEEKALSFSEFLTTVHDKSDLKFKLLTSCLKIWNTGHCLAPLLDTSSPDLASDNEPKAANVKDMLAPSCYSFREPAKRQRTEFYSQHYLLLIKLIWELQLLEFQFRQLCAVDLRVYILPLLRSFLRMKLYMFIGIGDVPVPGDVKYEIADDSSIMEGSREERFEEHVHRKAKRQPAAEDCSDMVIPDMSSYNRSEEKSTALELGSAGSCAIRASDPLVMVQYGKLLMGEPPGACVQYTDSSASQVERADAVISRSNTCILAALRSDFDSLSESGGEFEDVGSKIKEFSEMRGFSNVVWLMRTKCAWQNKDNGLFVCIMINDVVKHCLEKFDLQTAQNIWSWKCYRTLKYWRCFECGRRFPNQKSHLLHLGLSWDQDWSVPFHVKQEGESGVNEGDKDRSITVDCTYRSFIVALEEFGSLYQNEEGRGVQNVNQFGQIVEQIRQQICCLVNMFCTKSKLCSTSQIGDLDAEIVQNYSELKMSKQNLSNLCVSEYEKDILPSVCSFLQKRMDSGFRSWALQRLNELLCDVRCPRLHRPGSFSIQLASPGKVIISIEENNAGIAFAYVGIRWDFSGDVLFLFDVSSQEPKKIKGIFMFSGTSNSHNTMRHQCNIILDREIKKTRTMFCFVDELKMQLTMDLKRKLRQFQAETREKLQG